MKKFLIVIALLSVHYHLLAQVTYEEGYLVDNTGARKEVLILDKGWRSNPATITYKVNENASAQTVGISDIEEFGVGDELVFIKKDARIDRSSERVGRMTSTRDPQFVQEEVFLKLLVKGEADFYQYREGEIERYFYSLKDVAVKPLVHKKYLEEGRVAINNSFRQQLYENFQCGELTAAELRDINYNEDDLVDFFENYNSCLNAEYTVYRERQSSGDFNLYLKAGADFASMSVAKGMNVAGNDIDLGVNPRIGAELEYVLPFNRNKWAVFAEGTYQSYKVDEVRYNKPPYDMEGVLFTMDMQYVAVAGGVRHYFFLNQNSKLFVNAAFSFDIPLTTQILLNRGDRYELQPELTTGEATTGAYAIAGVGYNYGNRISAEVRYNFPRTTTGAKLMDAHYDLNWESTVSSFSVVLGYRLF